MTPRPKTSKQSYTYKQKPASMPETKDYARILGKLGGRPKKGIGI